MKVRVVMLVQDPMTAKYQGLPGQEGFEITREDFFLDGPVTHRVAVLDFDPKTGELLPGAAFLPPSPHHTLGRYHIARKGDFYARDFNQVSVFATVLKTIYMYEEKDNLGRPLTWAFDGPQLLVIPRAGGERLGGQQHQHRVHFGVAWLAAALRRGCRAAQLEDDEQGRYAQAGALS
jgi:hypothetical protein